MNIHCQHSRRGVDTPFLCPRAGHREMMRDTTLALGDGVLLGKDPWELDHHVNGASSTINKILGSFQGPSQTRMVHSAHFKNRQRGLTLARPTAAPTATSPLSLRVFFNKHCTLLWQGCCTSRVGRTTPPSTRCAT